MRQRAQRVAAACLVVAVAGILAFAAAAAPPGELWRPERGDVVVARVSPSGEARELRRRLAVAPGDREAALGLVRLHLTAVRRDGDPRHLGQAEAALGQWANDPRPPADVLVLRATLRQARHDFDGALADLDAALAVAPDDVQAWLTRAVVLTIRGRYDEARASCARLAPALPFAATACVAPIDGLTGRAAAARRALTEALVSAGESERSWGESLLGELSLWAGDAVAAESHLVEALRLDPDDRYSRGLLADLLLDGGRAADALSLLHGREADDALLLRLTLAARATGSPSASGWSEALRERFVASRRLGNTLHAREEARFALHVDGDADAALALAQQSWASQHEPWDARLLLEAALAAGRPEAAAPVLAWLDATGFEDPRLRALAKATIR